MEVHVKPEVQAKLDEIARESGQSCDELVEDALIGYFDELASLRETLDRRYDEIESGKVKMIDGEEAYRRLMEKAETHRRRNQPE
jgi:predicted transcriptional regulator